MDRAPRTAISPPSLIEDFLDVAHLLLDLAFSLVGTAFVTKVRIADYFTGTFLDLALGIFPGAFRLVLGTRFHVTLGLRFETGQLANTADPGRPGAVPLALRRGGPFRPSENFALRRPGAPLVRRPKSPTRVAGGTNVDSAPRFTKTKR